MSSHPDRLRAPHLTEQSDDSETGPESSGSGSPTGTTDDDGRHLGVETGTSLQRRVHAASLEGEITVLAAERDALADEVNALEAAVAKLESEVDELERAVDRKDGELDELRRHYERLITERERANGRLREERDRHARTSSLLDRGVVRFTSAVRRLVERLRG